MVIKTPRMLTWTKGPMFRTSNAAFHSWQSPRLGAMMWRNATGVATFEAGAVTGPPFLTSGEGRPKDHRLVREGDADTLCVPPTGTEAGRDFANKESPRSLNTSTPSSVNIPAGDVISPAMTFAHKQNQSSREVDGRRGTLTEHKRTKDTRPTKDFMLASSNHSNRSLHQEGWHQTRQRTPPSPSSPNTPVDVEAAIKVFCPWVAGLGITDHEHA